MKVYIAASFNAQDEMRYLAKKLEAAGHEVTSTWIFQEAENANENPMLARKFAFRDLTEIKASDVVVVVTTTPTTGGGLHVETGLALAWKKVVVLLGPCENVFHWLPEVLKASNISGVLERLAESVAPLPKTPNAAGTNSSSV